MLTVGLVLVTAGAVLLLYALYYARGYSALEVGQLSSRVAQGQSVVQAATGDPAALARLQKLQAMRADYQVLAQRQINWGDIFQSIADVPAGVVVRSASQAGFGVTVNGSAINQDAAAKYLQQLRSSGLFVNASIQVVPSTHQFVFPTSTPPPTPIPTPRPPPTPVPAIISTPPISRPTATVRPAPPTPRPTNTPRATATAIATATITPTPTMTSTPKPTSTPAFDFALISLVQVAASNPNAPNSDVKGQVLDARGQGVAGLTIEIDSEGQPPWSAQTTTANDGTFDFNVNHGKFQVEVVSGRSQVAKDLYTGADGTSGTWGYQLVFEETFTGPVPTVPPGLYTPTWTPTPDPTATITPVAPGANVAGLGCTSAYLVQNGQRINITGSTNPNLAIDNNFGTEWNANAAPSTGTQVIWSWSLYDSPSDSPCYSASNTPSGAGLPDSQDQINGIELYPDQSTGGNTVHELWLYSDPGCTNNLASTGAAYFVWQQYTDANSILPLSFSQLPVRCVIIRTLSDPSYVAWKEIQIFQALPPPNGFPTFTATPISSATPTSTSTPTATPTQCTPTCTPTPTATTPPTPTLSPTATIPPTSTPTLTPTAVFTAPANNSGIGPCCNVAGNAPLVSYSSGEPPATQTAVDCQTAAAPTIADHTNLCAVVDKNQTTYWAPIAGSQDPQTIQVNFDLTAVYNSSLNYVTDVKVQVEWSGNITGTQELYTVQLSNGSPLSCNVPSQTPSMIADQVWLDCPVPTPYAAPGPDYVTVRMQSGSTSNSTEDGTYGIREIEVFSPPTSSSQRSASVSPKAVGQGRGPGLADINGPNLPPNVTSQAPVQNPVPVVGTPLPPPPITAQSTTSGIPASNPNGPITGPVDFTIVLETASGKGYP